MDSLRIPELLVLALSAASAASGLSRPMPVFHLPRQLQGGAQQYHHPRALAAKGYGDGTGAAIPLDAVFEA